MASAHLIAFLSAYLFMSGVKQASSMSHDASTTTGSDAQDGTCMVQARTDTVQRIQSEAQKACTNTCSYHGDGDCDDGGDGSSYSLCSLGTDCDDCGTREASAPVKASNPVPASTPAQASNPVPASTPAQAITTAATFSQGACYGGTCCDTSGGTGGAKDSWGSPCMANMGTSSCNGDYDDDDFTASAMCCDCGGGRAPEPRWTDDSKVCGAAAVRFGDSLPFPSEFVSGCRTHCCPCQKNYIEEWKRRVTTFQGETCVKSMDASAANAAAGASSECTQCHEHLGGYFGPHTMLEIWSAAHDHCADWASVDQCTVLAQSAAQVNHSSTDKRLAADTHAVLDDSILRKSNEC